ncbi:MAG: C-type lectin domain-containing protein [Deltaproteobacteria bacterium]|nr:C-type lectin domain-containing protein [Deltaproteobacteria bacterium]MBN2674791.1 C-type lectin domain-containing protein [Deltaproteobacteria bacterium]
MKYGSTYRARFIGSAAILLLAMSIGCSTNDTKTSKFTSGQYQLTGTPAALSDEAARTFGFEDAANDWSVITSTNSAHTEGTVSGEVNVTGWMQITSNPLSSIAAEGVAIGGTAAIDVRLPESVGWGDMRVVLNLPSQGLYWVDLGGPRLDELTVGSFTEVNFTLTEQVQAALNAAYTDLQVFVIINGPTMSSPVLLDNLRFAAATASNDTESGPEVSFNFELPVGVALESVVVETAESLRIADAVHAANAPANVINMGSQPAEIGADAEVDGNVIARSDVFLRERTTIHGTVEAAGAIEEQNSVVYDAAVPNSTINVGGTYQWSVAWPEVNGVYAPEPDSEPIDLQPGAYVGVTLKPRTDLTLHAGTYYFDYFYGDPEAVIHVIGNGEPVILYVRDSFTSRSTLDHSYSSADFFIAFAGEGTVDLDGPFAGTVVAPNATVRLAPLNGGSHEGSFFAKRVDAEARTPINLVPFDHWDVLIDSCPGNPNKMSPGECGCGMADDDADGDGYADCIDLCDDDPHKQFPGIAGCGNSDTDDCDSDMIPDAIDPWVCEENIHSDICENAPDGTICNDGLCNGVYQCQDGQCGDPADCRPECDGTCTEIALERTTYVVCDCQVSWSEASSYCREDEGRMLVRLNSHSENDLVTSFLDDLGISNAWIGANDVTAEGKWQWQNYTRNNGKLFWVGDETGYRHFSSVAKWAEGEPDGGAAGDCGALNNDGTWSDDVCMVTKAFVCEAPGQRTPRRGGDKHVGIPTYADPDECDTEIEQQLNPAGVKMGDEATISAAMKEKYRKCSEEANDQTEYEDSDCHLLDIGEVPTGNTCPVWETDTEVSADDDRRETFFPVADCELTIFESFGEIPIGGGNNIPSPPLCERNNDCNNGYCGKISRCCSVEDGDCNWLQVCARCDEDDDACHEAQCGADNRCVTFQACGIPQNSDEEACFEELGDPAQPCEQVELCTPADDMEIDNEGNSFFNAAETPEDVNTQFPYAEDEEVPPDTDTAFSNDEFDAPCGGSPCTMSDNTHPWCKYNVVPPSSVAEGENVGSTMESDINNDSNENDKTINFNFSPVFEWDYDAKPGPLGFFEPLLSTHAGVKSDVTLTDVFGGNSTISLIDAQLFLRLGLEPLAVDETINEDTPDEYVVKGTCGLSTLDPSGASSKIEILGMDFLPDSLQDFVYPDQEAQNTCIQGYRDFKETVNQAKKAMRDAQELIRIYNAARERGEHFADGVLCEDFIRRLVVDGKGERIPQEFIDHAENCTNKTAESTINLFIDYYQQQAIPAIKPALAALVDATVPLGVEKEIDIVGWGDEKEITLFNQNFMIGPIPCNLEVFISLAYGFDVAAKLTFTPANMLKEILETPRESAAEDYLASTVASIGLIAEPYAAARVGLFVGVGFDIGFAAAKAGIEGIVSIGEISVPAEATVGLAFEAVDDTRELTGSLANIAAGGSEETSYWYTPRKFSLKLLYGMNIGVDITDILAGSVGVKLKLKFLFFSKTWRQKIATWNGLCSSNIPKADRPDWCSFDLLNFNGELATEPRDLPWAYIKMPDPFVQLAPVRYKPNTDANGNIVEDTLITLEDEQILSESKANVHEFFYGVQCNLPPVAE